MNKKMQITMNGLNWYEIDVFPFIVLLVYIWIYLTDTARHRRSRGWISRFIIPSFHSFLYIWIESQSKRIISKYNVMAMIKKTQNYKRWSFVSLEKSLQNQVKYFFIIMTCIVRIVQKCKMP